MEVRVPSCMLRLPDLESKPPSLGDVLGVFAECKANVLRFKNNRLLLLKHLNRTYAISIEP